MEDIIKLAKISAVKEILVRVYTEAITKNNSDVPSNYIPGMVENIVDDYIAELEK